MLCVKNFFCLNVRYIINQFYKPTAPHNNVSNFEPYIMVAITAQSTMPNALYSRLFWRHRAQMSIAYIHTLDTTEHISTHVCAPYVLGCRRHAPQINCAVGRKGDNSIRNQYVPRNTQCFVASSHR